MLDVDVDSTLKPPLPDPPGLSLLSLSIAASNATPIALQAHPDPPSGIPQSAPASEPAVNGHLPGSTTTSQGTTTTATGGKQQHRRLSSAGKARRRLSDARDAAARPSLQTTSLPPLSLSTSLPTQPLSTVSPLLPPSKPSTSPHMESPSPVARKLSSSSSGAPTSPSFDEGNAFTPPSHGINNNRSNQTLDSALSNGVPVNGAKFGKKKGTDHRCETCSKIYRHPSCLIKHRWEHTPHWREASKFVLSKHQQVQLLEAAAILSHLSPSSATGTSLPEDRSLWPSFLSGGTLPPPSTSDTPTAGSAQSFPSDSYAGYPISNSVPASSTLNTTTRATSTGPRLHDYAIPTSAQGSGSITQLRPGILGVSTGPGVGITSNSSPSSALASGLSPDTTPPTNGTLPVPVPTAPGGPTCRRRGGGGFGDDRSESWGSRTSPQYGRSSYTSIAPISSSFGGSFTGGGGWSLPRSSLRSVSGSSRSRSRSGSVSRSDEESEPMDGDVELVGANDELITRQYGYSSRGRASEWKSEDEEMRLGYSVREEDEYEEMGKDGRVAEETWDGMDMEMEMD